MIHTVDIRALAQLARLAISDAEVEKLEHEIPAILSFVETLQKVAGNVAVERTPEQRNIFREDTLSYSPGTYTKDILAEAPAREGDKIAVKKVLSKNNMV